MKKSLSFLSALALCCALSACGGQGGGAGASQAPATPQPTQPPVSTQPLETPDPSASAEVPALSAPVDETAGEGRILIAYFAYGENAPLADGVDASTSASIQYRDGKLTGNTGLVAGMIAGATGGDLFSILTAEQYPDSYDDTIDVGKEEKRADARPELSSHIEDLDRYDTIFLGFPNWWGDMPMAVYSFLDEYDFSGKTIVLFCTSGGSGIANSVSNIRGLAGGATWMDGRRFSGGASRDAMIEWVNSLNLGIQAN